MKKLMLAAAIVCAAAMAQAATIDWSCTSYNYVTKDGAVQTAVTADTGTFVLCYLGDTSTGYSWDNAVVVNEGSVAYKNSMGSLSAKASGSYDVDMTKYENGDVFGVMFKDDKGNLSQLVYSDSSKDSTTYTISGLADPSSTLAGFTFATGNYHVEAVPEPTSALLLLLGMAGLALKRKRA